MTLRPNMWNIGNMAIVTYNILFIIEYRLLREAFKKKISKKSDIALSLLGLEPNIL